MVYGWNDMVDYETDLLNPRKNTYWFGARASKEVLKGLWKPILIVQILTVPFLIYFGGMYIIPVFLGFLLINGLYNLPNHGLRSLPPLELICQIGYLLIVPLSILINDTAIPPWQTFFYLFLFSMQSHLMGEVMDIAPDRAANRKTTATIIGAVKTKMIIIFLVMIEVAILVYYFGEYIFGATLGLGLIWLLLDLFFIYKNKVYTIGQMKLFALLSNVMAIATIGYVWWSGCLLQVVR